MCALRRLVIVLFLLGIGLPSSVSLSATRPADTDARVRAARQRLTETHWRLISGVSKVDQELKGASESNTGARSILKSYRMQFNRLLAKVGTLGRGQRPVLSSRDREDISAYVEQVDQVYLTTLRLSSNFETLGMTRVRKLEGQEPAASLAPVGTSSCYGSIAGTVLSPSGSLDDILVAAYTAEDSL